MPWVDFSKSFVCDVLCLINEDNFADLVTRKLIENDSNTIFLVPCKVYSARLYLVSRIFSFFH